jgi:hypothetical protein
MAKSASSVASGRAQPQPQDDIERVGFALCASASALWIAADVHRLLSDIRIAWFDFLFLVILLLSVLLSGRGIRERSGSGRRFVVVVLRVATGLFVAASILLWAHRQRFF